MILPITLRRILLMLLSAAVFIIMVLYWSQSIVKPHFVMGTQERISDYHEKDVHHTTPTENMWTYQCQDDRCVRIQYRKKERKSKRVSFMTCSMTCGNLNVWPFPTKKVSVSLKSLSFSVENVKLQTNTPNIEQKQLLTKAFDLFIKDLIILQRVKDIANINTKNQEHKSQLESAPSQTLGEKETILSILRKNTYKFENPADLKSVTVNVTVNKMSDTNMNLNTDESYKLSTNYQNSDCHVQISAKTFFGARHALSTLLQLIWYDDEDNLLRTLSKAEIVDSPKFRYRGLMLDTSRHYFSVESIKKTIVAMSYAKLNRFHWHLTDSQSFPFISTHYPQLAKYGAYSNRETYTPDDIRNIAEFAKLHGVQIIPEIDAPAHAGNGWNFGPENGLGDLSLCINQQPWSFYCGEPPCGQLNPKNNNTFLILQRLYEELLNLTGSTDYYHLGGDEVNLECWGQYFNDTDLRGLWCDFMINAFERLKAANKNISPKLVSVWSSGLTNTKCLASSQFAVQMWGGSTWQENYDLIENGYNIIFSHVNAWYLDCGFGSWRSTGLGACSPYSTWKDVYKHRPWKQMRLNKTSLKQILGGEVCMWTEQVDESQLDNRLWPRSASLGERLWSDPENDIESDGVPEDVIKRMSIFRNRLVDMGIQAESIFPKYCSQNPGECI